MHPCLQWDPDSGQLCKDMRSIASALLHKRHACRHRRAVCQLQSLCNIIGCFQRSIALEMISFGGGCRLLWTSLAAQQLWRALSCRQLLTRQTVYGCASTPRSPSPQTAMHIQPCMIGSSLRELDDVLIPSFCHVILVI